MGAAFSAVGFEGSSEFNKSKKITNKFVKSVGSKVKRLIGKEVHTQTMKRANKAIKKTLKYAAKVFRSELASTSISYAISKGYNRLSIIIYNGYRANMRGQ